MPTDGRMGTQNIHRQADEHTQCPPTGRSVHRMPTDGRMDTQVPTDRRMGTQVPTDGWMGTQMPTDGRMGTQMPTDGQMGTQNAMYGHTEQWRSGGNSLLTPQMDKH